MLDIVETIDQIWRHVLFGFLAGAPVWFVAGWLLAGLRDRRVTWW